MDTQELLRNLGERLGTSASVKNVYGDPVTVGGRTVIPVARFFYSFGGGGGRRQREEQGSGGGGGGMVAGGPAGALEVTASGTRFVGVHDTRMLAIAVAAGFMAGAVVGLIGRWRAAGGR